MPVNPLTSPDQMSEEDTDDAEGSSTDDDENGSSTVRQYQPPPALMGLYCQYFAVGLVSGVLPGTLYGFFMGYLQVESHVYATAAQVVSLPWSFKFVYGILNDCVPIRGYRRVPYMALGWIITAAALVALANQPMPARGDSSAAALFSVYMALAAVGYVMADVAADGLTVQNAKHEPLAVRGTLQANVYLMRTIGSIVASLFVGLGMNGKEYLGTFKTSLSLTHVCGTLVLPALLMVPISCKYIEETVVEEPVQSVRQYLHECWCMLCSKAMFYVVVYNLGHSIVGSIYTTASGNVSLVWANVQNLQAKVFSVVAMGIFAFGLAVVKKHLLQYSWRSIIAYTTVVLGVVDATFAYCTIYNVVRNQYFYLGEEIIVMVPAAAKFLVTTFVVVEMSPKGKEGITYGMLTTLHNLGGPIARAISNQFFGLAFHGLSAARNYIDDTPQFRTTVAWSYVISYLAGLGGLAFLRFMPDQKKEALLRVKKWGSSIRYAQVTVATVAVCWLYAMVINVLAMMPATSCLTWVGGSGCQ